MPPRHQNQALRCSTARLRPRLEPLGEEPATARLERTRAAGRRPSQGDWAARSRRTDLRRGDEEPNRARDCSAALERRLRVSREAFGRAAREVTAADSLREHRAAVPGRFGAAGFADRSGGAIFNGGFRSLLLLRSRTINTRISRPGATSACHRRPSAASWRPARSAPSQQPRTDALRTTRPSATLADAMPD